MGFFLPLIFAFIVAPKLTSAITTTHHDKPDDAKIQKMATQMQEPLKNVNLTNSERQKRLLPYANFYLGQSFNQPIRQQQPSDYQSHNNYVTYSTKYQDGQETLYQANANNKFTPFLESNAIPGQFRPMVNNQQPPQRIKVQYIPLQQVNKVPNYGVIYDKLAQLKLSQNTRRPTYYRINPQPQRYVDDNKQVVQYQPYKTIQQPSKTFIETYTATNIDIPTGPAEDSYQQLPKQIPEPVKSYEVEQHYEPPQQYVTLQYQKPDEYHENSRNPSFIVLQQQQKLPQIPKPIIYIQRKPVVREKPIAIIDEKFVADKIVPGQKYQHQVIYEPRYPETVPVPKYQQPQVAYHQPPPQTENPNSLNQILKQLQDTNTLPHTLTADNIDNSIKTLVKILGALRKQQKITKPIIVPDEPVDYHDEEENEAGVGQEVPTSQNYPADTPDGGTPGKAGVDYPALSTIPQTSFNCKTQRYKGFFGDPDTHCQVWHYCDLNGGQASFLCPNGTIFSQVALTCDWWYNVKCSSTAQLYVLNERLYKYILPLAPKFPEDYNGPLVDKYLALKFQEMEEKMRKEKKGKGNVDDKDKESEELSTEEDESKEESTEAASQEDSQEPEEPAK